MSLDPEFFRGMDPSQIMTALVIEESVAKGTRARAVGASCTQCVDTGMSAGVFCSCPKGTKLALQGFRP